MLTRHGILFNDNAKFRQWPELQERKIKQKFILSGQRLPKENCLVFMRLAPISRVFFLLWLWLFKRWITLPTG